MALMDVCLQLRVFGAQAEELQQGMVTPLWRRVRRNIVFVKNQLINCTIRRIVSVFLRFKYWGCTEQVLSSLILKKHKFFSCMTRLCVFLCNSLQFAIGITI